MKSEPNITRVKYGGTCGWWVRLYRSEADGTKRCYSKLFSDGVHGGCRKALVAARIWRDAEVRRLPKTRRASGNGRVPPGYGYVKRLDLMRRADVHPVYLAWMRVDRGRSVQTSRSITLWGVAGARLQCEEWLAAKRRELRKRVGRVSGRTRSST